MRPLAEPQGSFVKDARTVVFDAARAWFSEGLKYLIHMRPVDS